MKSATALIALASTIVVGCWAPTRLSAGLGPENVIVVVNGDSYDSRTLANHYVHYRDIPSSNVVILTAIPDKLTISLDGFKERILTPILDQISSRGLSGQARVIAYSAGFPTTVDIKKHTAKLTDPTLKKLQRPRASINGLTFFYRFILADDHRYLNLASNTYCRGPFNRNFANPFSTAANRASFKSADRLFETGEYEASATEFEKLFASSPRVAPLALRAAEAHVKAGNPAAGKSLILKAVAAGWSAKKWFEQNETLAPLINQPPISSLASRLSDHPIEIQSPIGFTSQAAWTASGYPVGNAREGAGYMLSCTLGVVRPRASDLNQAIAVLKRAATSDQTYPKGVFWFAISNDVRTKTRILQMDPAKEYLSFLGMKAESPFGANPKKPGRPIGLMLGTPKIKIVKRKWDFVPGAIADNLTSFGAVYSNASQSKLNVLLHAGAAMSSGTVAEPYAIQAKFPLPAMYAYYAAGATALESFYLSVASPYQLLIVGDPLTQPFSRPPNDQVSMKRRADADGGPVIEVVRQPVKAAGNKIPRSPTGATEIYLDGKLVRRVPALGRMNLRLPKQLLGAIELRTILIANDLLQPRASHVHWFHDRDPATPTATEVPGTTDVAVACPEATSIDLLNHNEVIGTITGSTGKISVDPRSFGGGPLKVHPVAKFGESIVKGRPVVLQLPVDSKPFPE